MTTAATPAQYDILIIRGAQTEAEKVQQQLGLKFNWLSVPPEWTKIEDALKQHPIKVVIIAGGRKDMVYDYLRYSEEVIKPEASIFVVTTTPSLLATLVNQFQAVKFFNALVFGNLPNFASFDQLINCVKAEIIH